MRVRLRHIKPGWSLRAWTEDSWQFGTERLSSTLIIDLFRVRIEISKDKPRD